ncbi:MAG TPA: Asp-tRNA(Asn)/Glu-tRNA(Gln) amidotransferase GatCAB subunit A [Firmicutes bacterium]|jgi:aspartyl-tRNA(Asn)/glutamyl-tRNA(Gln) amidotransferase subunit A|nr:Asp-tRNA(Asn)/Glu-tRNA(Gln) amidotransferase GatCAB subunit A [Bacillota bacterium]
MEIAELNVAALRKMLDRREISAVELTNYYLDRIAQLDPDFRAFITVSREQALRMASAADQKLATGEGATALTGIPVAVKDNICTNGIRTTCASRLLADFTPIFDATVVAKLKQVGAVLLGKTNLDEFAMGSSTKESAYGLTPNPWDRRHVSGGSSSGSAVAVATGMVPLALGSDTGGSIRQPAAFCGVWGLKPTYGRVSRYGLVPYAPSLDQIGPIGRSTEDIFLLDRCIAGYDPLDPTSLPEQAAAAGIVTGSLRGLKVGLPRELFGDSLAMGVKERVMAVARELAAAGCILTELSLPSLQYALPTYYLLAYAEASSSMARYDGVRHGKRACSGSDVTGMMTATRQELGTEVKRRILLGTYFLGKDCYDDYYVRAQQVRTWMKADFAAAFTECDLLLSPTTATPAFTIDEEALDERALALTECYTVAANLTGIPALTFPCGFLNHLPVGAQLMAPAGAEQRLFQVASHWEAATKRQTRCAQGDQKGAFYEL